MGHFVEPFLGAVSCRTYPQDGFAGGVERGNEAAATATNRMHGPGAALEIA